MSWIEGDLQYRPELGVYDVHAAKFIYFDWKASDEINNVILNAHGGLRENRAIESALTYPGGGSLRGLPPSVNPSGNNIHTHTHT